MSCELCDGTGGALVAEFGDFRIVRALNDPDHPYTYRVVATEHARELNDLAPFRRRRLADAVSIVEAVLRRALEPAKINVASLGNLCPHVHWHVIPRFPDDRHFPSPVWSAPRREPLQPAPNAESLARSDAAVRGAVGAVFGGAPTHG